MLTLLSELPAGLLECNPATLADIIPGPTLIHLPGRQARPLFLSLLLHGDEDTGLQALQRLLRDYRGRDLPRALSVFIGNVVAARAGLRRLDQQPDYNRIWPGGNAEPGAETKMATAVVEEMRRREVFASVDVHNNTGLNPHYGCINRLDSAFLHLASWFSRTVVYFTHPRGTQTAAFAALCPAVTLECGKPGTAYGARHASEYIDGCLHLTQFPEQPLRHEDVDLYHTVGVVKIPPGVTFTFANANADIRFESTLDHMNFRELRPNTPFAELTGRQDIPLEAIDVDGNNVTDTYFANCNGQLCSKAAFMPAMLTLNERAIRQDCLCYIMQRLPLPNTHNLA